MTAVKTIGLLTSAFIGLGGLLSDAHGEAAQDFYRNKQVRLIVGHPVGNDHDIGGRLLAKYLGKYIPGRPNVIVQNMTAAASVAAANHVYGQAPRDGTVMGTFSRNFPSQAMMGQPNIEADPRRFLWLGATSFPGRVCTASATAAVKTPADLFTSELIVGGSGRRLDAEHRADRAQPCSRYEIPHRRGLQGRAGCCCLPSSAVRCRACARPTASSAVTTGCFARASCAFSSASRKRRSRTGPTCRPFSERPRPTSSASSCASCFRASSSAPLRVPALRAKRARGDHA